MKRSLIVFFIVVGAAAMTAQADMTYSPFMYNALDASGNAIANGTYLLVLDLNGNGWQGTGYTAQSSGAANSSNWLWDPCDYIMDRGAIGEFNNSGGYAGECYPFDTIKTSQIPAGYTANVDHYYLLWFDTPYNASATGPGAGVHYGAEDLGVVGTDPGDYTTFPNGGNASLITIAGAMPWHNPALAADVNGDGSVTSADALAIIAKLNLEGSHALQTPGDPLPPTGQYWDVSGDATPYISPLDAIIVIDQLNGAVGSPSMHLSGGMVPEPATVLLLLLGSALIRARRAK